MNRIHLFVLLLLVILGLAVYSNTFRNSFHFDDEHHIKFNPHIRSLRNIPLFFTDPRTASGSESKDTKGGFYRPLLMVTHALNYAVGGLNPFGYHLVNLGFHVGSAYLLFLIVQAMLGTHIPPHTLFIPLSSALIFLVHPFNSEVVNYITARSSVMSSFFYLLSFYCWVRFREKGVSLTPYYIASLLAFLLALLTKEITATLPIMLVAYDLYFAGEGWSRFLKRSVAYLPFFLLTGLFLLLRKFMLGSAYTEQYGGYVNTLNHIRVLSKYIQFLIWPSSLSIEHDLSDITNIFQWEFLSALIVLILIFIVGIWLGIQKKVGHPISLNLRIVSFFILWYFLVLLPMLPLTFHAMLQENRGFLAGIIFPVFVGIVISTPTLSLPLRPIALAFGRNGDPGGKKGGGEGVMRGKFIWVSLLIPLIILYSTLTIIQNRVWKDDVTLWRNAVEKNPYSIRAYGNLGRAYLRRGDLGPAERNLLHALDMGTTFSWIDYLHIQYDLGLLYHRLKRFDLAREHMLEAIRRAPDEAGFYVKLGNIYGTERRWAEAEESYKKALEIRPEYTEALASLGIVYMMQERYREAIPYLTEAVKDKEYHRIEEVQTALKKSLEMITPSLANPPLIKRD